MIKTDAQEFFAMWDGISEMYDKPQGEMAKKIVFNTLAPYTLVDVVAAIDAHLADPSTGKWMPKPADIIAKIEAVSTEGFLGAEEAWALFPDNESVSACVTQEASEAYGVTVGLDRIAARMTFKEKYTRLVARAKAEKRKPVYFISLGTDKQSRVEVTLQAVTQGFISADRAHNYIPQIEKSEILALANKQTSASAVIERSEQNLIGMSQLLIAAEEKSASPEFAKKHLAEINKMLGIRP